MKKQTIIVILLIIGLTSCKGTENKKIEISTIVATTTTTTTTAHPEKPTNPDLVTIKGYEWEPFEKGYYRVYIPGDNPILVKRLGDLDLDKMWEGIDKNLSSEKREKLFYEEMIEKTQIKRVNKEEINGEAIRLQGKFRGKNQDIDLLKIKDGDSVYIMPVMPDHFPGEFVAVPILNKSYIASNDEIWSIDHRTGEFTKVSKDISNGKTYEEITQSSIDLYGVNYVIWNANLVISPDKNKFVYSSNRDDVKTGVSSVYLFDTLRDTEIKLIGGADTGYSILGWLDNEHILCRKDTENSDEHVVVDLSGNEVVLNLEGDDPNIYDMNNYVIAYGDILNGNTVNIVKYKGVSDLEKIASMSIKGNIRIRGQIGLNPDNTKFCTLYANDAFPADRNLALLDLETKQVSYIESSPENSGFILEFNWIKENQLLVVCEKNKFHSTWICKIPEE